MAHGLQLALQLANCSYSFVAKHGQAATVLVARVVVLFAVVPQTLEGALCLDSALACSVP